MNPVDVEHVHIVNHYLMGKMRGLDFPEAPDFSIFFDIASPQQLPFHHCKGRPVAPHEYLFFATRSNGDKIPTRTGFYQMLGNDELIFDPSCRGVIGYFRRYRFYYNNDGQVPTDTDASPVKSNWIVEEFRLNHNNNPNNENRASTLALCKVKKDNVNRAPDIHPPGYEFEPYGSEILDYYLKKNILGLYIPFDQIPSFEVFSAPSPDDLPFDLFESRTHKGRVWHFFCHISYKHGTERGETKGFYKPDGDHYEHIYDDRSNKLLGYSRILTYYHKNSNGESRKSKWTIEEFKVDPRVVEVHPDDAFTKELVSDLAVYKVVYDEESRVYPHSD